MNQAVPVAGASRRAIIDRRALADRIAALPERGLRKAVLETLCEALAAGRAEIAAQLAADPGNGRGSAAANAFLIEQLVRLAFDVVTARLYPNPNPSTGERVALVAVGGTGRGQMAPYSDVDLLFLVGSHSAPWCEQVSEALLYLLWDMKLKVGQAVRTVDEAVAAARADMTVRTAMLEARWLWGDEAMAREVERRFRREVVADTTREFVVAKLAERDERHLRMGDSRYVVEPNVKDGKGGLRDLHTLYWIGLYASGAETPAGLVEAGFLTPREKKAFDRAERFLWAVRCHLHQISGRAEERLGFDVQREIAARMKFADRPGKSAVERFMHFYFLNAKAVGDLTGLFLAQLDEQMAAKNRRFAFPSFRRAPTRLHGFTLERGRISIPSDDWLGQDPLRLIDLFAIAAREGLEIHPAAMRAASAHARAVDAIREDGEANALFLDVLTARQAPDTVLRWMNEAGVLGRFIPDFGRVVAQMQFNMYHHYTVDEHSIRAIGLLSRIERGELADDHPLSTALFRQISSRRTLYVAVLLHDIAKGRGGDHSVKGAEIADALCPRLGLSDAETETVSWLVRHHLLMSDTAFRRDLADPQTIADFVRIVQSPERLRLLLVLTVVDIRAVGPTTWTEWKRALLRNLFELAEEQLRLGHKQRGRKEQVAERQEQLRDALDWSAGAARAHMRRLPDSYWLAEPGEWQLANARLVARAEARIGDPVPEIEVVPDADSGLTRLTCYAPDRPGLFARLCTSISDSGASILDARIHTTRDGMALDNLLVGDGRGRAFADASARERLAKRVRSALVSEAPLAMPPLGDLSKRDRAFRLSPSVFVAERASNRTTVVEVNARDRNGLLARLAQAIHAQGLAIHSAHITTYGERAVDVFYLTGADGRQLDAGAIDALRPALLDAAGN